VTDLKEDDNILVSEFYFPSGIYKIKKPEFIESAKKVMKNSLSCCNEEVNEIYPISHTSHMFDEELADLLNYIAQTGWNILESQGYDMSLYDTSVTDFWGQKLLKHGQQHEHIHGFGAQLVGFYFLNVPEKSTRPFIVDPRPAKIQINLPQTNGSLATYGSDKVNFDVNAGDLFFTNAWLAHGFEPNASDEPFEFIHFIIHAVPTKNTNETPEVI